MDKNKMYEYTRLVAALRACGVNEIKIEEILRLYEDELFQ